jgi:hypothetical protein
MFVIDRQLLQRQLLGFAQLYNALHQLPRHHDDARIARFKSIGQEHLKPLLAAWLDSGVGGVTVWSASALTTALVVSG